MASSTFASLQFLKPRVFPWVGVFSDWHAVACWGWLMLVVSVSWRDLRRPDRAGRLAIFLLTGCAAITVGNALYPVLPGLSGGAAPVLVGILALAPLIGLAAIDHVVAFSFLERQTCPVTEDALRSFEGRLFAVTGTAALFTTAVYAALASLALSDAFEPDLMTPGLASGLTWSLVDHLWVACATFLAIAAIGRLARGRFLLQYGLLCALLATIFAVAFQRLAGDSIGLIGGAGTLAAGAFGVSLVGTWTGLRLRRLQEKGKALGSALDAFIGPQHPGGLTAAGCLAIAATAGLAYACIVVTHRADWDFVLLKSGVVAVWTVIFGVVYRITSGPVRAPTWSIALICLAPLMIQQGISPSPTARRWLARYAVYNPSFRFTQDLLHHGSATPAFDRFLRAHTGIPEDVPPVDVDFVRGLTRSPIDPKPLIFLFVIDSLRPDYLGAYNPAVRFTPRLDAFAAESLVFRNAFTRYGATGMSVPAIWAGSVILHKQYVHPFHPMNALEKLLDANGYRRFLGLDSVLQQLLLRSDNLDELDRDRTTMGYEFCSTLDQLESKLASADPHLPIFAYSLPQDVHMSRLPRSVEAGPEYQAFHAPYATKVHAIDACFGRFIDTLKARGVYDRSLVILTADHGEMLGEDGQVGHSYHLFPPIVQIPLIVHLPSALNRVASVDVDAVSLSTDITPTIYSALGYRPEHTTPLMGRSLLATNDSVSRERRRESVVIAASYGPVYAVLRHNGRRLYIADAIKGGDLAYDRDLDGRWRTVDVTPGQRTINQFLIRQHIDEVTRVFQAAAPK
ncbi:MAG: sulfatase-like hydrolase/transferase [Acidobacteriota bacterium]